MTWRQARMFKPVLLRPRLFFTLAVTIAVGLLLPAGLMPHALTRWLVAWNAGSVLYVALATLMMVRSSQDHMQRRGRLHDDGQLVILLLVVLTAVASVGAIAGELALARQMHGAAKGWHVALAGITVFTSWGFIQVMFAIHYAHDYYAALVHGRPPGLRFPDDDAPDYGDFFYFAAVIGTSGQTADVSFVSKPMRRVGALHCVLAFLFNTTVLALLINIGASLV